MIKITLISFFYLLLSINIAYPQAPSIEWQKCYGGTGSEVSMDIQQTTDGGYIACGNSTSVSGDISANNGGIDYWVIKLDALGTIMWEKSLGGSGDDWGQSIQQTTDGGYIVAGYSNSVDGQVTGNHGDNDYWIVKLNSTGDISWQKSLGGSMADGAYNIKQTSDGGFIIAGLTESNDGNVTGNHGGLDYWIVKLDTSGNLIWQKTFGGSRADQARCIVETTDGGFIVTGTSASIDGDVLNGAGGGIAWIVKLNTIGNIEWQKTYGSRVGLGEESQNIIQTMDGGYVVSGRCAANGGDVTGYHGNTDYWVIKLDMTGNLIWQKALGGTTGDESFCVRQTIDGGYVVVGRSSSMNGDVIGQHGNFDMWVVKLSAAGSLLWQKTLGGITRENGFGIWQTTDGGFIVSGVASSNNNGDVGPGHGGNDFWIVKLGAETVPVTLTDFNVTQKGKDVLCKWKTSQEQNSSHFIIERSDDALHFTTAGNVFATGYSLLIVDYNFTDESALLTESYFLYYRLKMVDADGNFKYSNVAKIEAGFTETISVSPNPVVDLLQIYFQSPVHAQAVLSITDHSGKKMYQKNISVKQGKNTVPINVAFLPQGAYVLSIKGGKNYSARFVKFSD